MPSERKMAETRRIPSLANVHTTKRTKRERNGVHGWHPYYAGYAERFVSDVLSLLAEPEDIVLDPWNGSGTTTFVAQRSGFHGIGVEINPVMVIHAQAKNLEFPLQATQLSRKCSDIIQRAKQKVGIELDPDIEIENWVSGEALESLILLRDSIFESSPDPIVPDFASEIFVKPSLLRNISKETAFYLSALFQVLRAVGNFSQGSNPTWLKQTSQTDTIFTRENVFLSFQEVVEKMLIDLSAARTLLTSRGDYWVIEGNSCELSIESASIDLVVTSPPYCTRIDYAFATKPELALLGYVNSEFDSLRRQTMGAPVIVNKQLRPNETWGALCNDFLASVAVHPSKASSTYYLPTFVQYFHDAQQSLEEIYRILNQRGKAAIVVQSSYYKDIALPLGDIYVEMCEQVGFRATIAKRINVRQHMAHVNTKSRRYQQEKVYYEDVVLLEK